MVSYLFVFIGGFVAGLYGSSVGSGGLVSLPTLILTGLPIHIAIATNRFAVFFLETIAAIRFRKEIKFNVPFGLLLGFLAAIGAYFGSKMILNIEPELLNPIIAVVLILVFIFLLFNKKMEEKETHQRKYYLLLLITTVPLLGIYGGSFGAGFGTFTMILLIAAGYSYIQSAALSRVIGSIMSLTAALTFAFHGVIDYKNGIVLAAGYSLGGWIGAGISVKKGSKYVRLLLFVVVVISALKLVTQ